MKDWIERSDIKFSAQLNQFAQKISQYQSVLSLSNQEIADVQADAAFMAYMIKLSGRADEYKQACTALKQLARLGGDNKVIATLPAPVNAGTPPAIVPPNIEKRFRAIANRIKAHANYSKGIGVNLGIEKAGTTIITGEIKPKFTISFSSGRPVIKWVKRKFEGVEIWVNRGSGFSKLDRDMRSPYVDTHPLPEAGKSAIWKYKMIYLLKDTTIGEWSGEVSATVTGSV